jgi:hypothetical protein
MPFPLAHHSHNSSSALSLASSQALSYISSPASSVASSVASASYNVPAPNLPSQLTPSSSPAPFYYEYSRLFRVHWGNSVRIERLLQQEIIRKQIPRPAFSLQWRFRPHPPSTLSSIRSETEAIQYLFQRKWPRGFRCPCCTHSNHYVITTRRLPLYECASCSHQTSLTADTPMEKSRTPLMKWIQAMQSISSLDSINAIQLSSRIQVTYKTAWAMLMKLRKRMTAHEQLKLLSDEVHVGPAFYGRPPLYCPDRLHKQEHPILIGARLNSSQQPNYARFWVMPKQYLEQRRIERSGVELFIKHHVARGTDVIKQFLRFSTTDPHAIPQIFHYAKMSINRTFHGIGRKYLQQYFDEFGFRWNKMVEGVAADDALVTFCMSGRSTV